MIRLSRGRFALAVILVAMADVLTWRHILYIAQAGIKFIHVDMVNLVSNGTLPEKRERYKSMNIKCFISILAKSEFKVAPCADAGGQNAGRSNAPSSKAAHPPQVADLVALKAGYRLPCFSRKFFGCIFDDSHDLNLRSRLGLWSGSFAVQPAFEPLLF